MGTSDQLPGWAGEIRFRRRLWQDFGIPWDDAGPLEIDRIARLLSAEAERERNT